MSRYRAKMVVEADVYANSGKNVWERDFDEVDMYDIVVLNVEAVNLLDDEECDDCETCNCDDCYSCEDAPEDNCDCCADCNTRNMVDVVLSLNPFDRARLLNKG